MHRRVGSRLGFGGHAGVLWGRGRAARPVRRVIGLMGPLWSPVDRRTMQVDRQVRLGLVCVVARFPVSRRFVENRQKSARSVSSSALDLTQPGARARLPPFRRPRGVP
ncbi:hypothetical protein PAI11_13010 [Patulibacter medicamentivorans]|uniref:Uncharacterized protein n=1 Tax=Patulibacter medicamentivorans TaxID=1097667 RepID=H0E3D3_9ACTN|nr:hypothetical protein PAI11_13010 [Patulibacter medicamentivorans]